MCDVSDGCLGASSLCLVSNKAISLGVHANHRNPICWQVCNRITRYQPTHNFWESLICILTYFYRTHLKAYFHVLLIRTLIRWKSVRFLIYNLGISICDLVNNISKFCMERITCPMVVLHYVYLMVHNWWILVHNLLNVGISNV